MITLEELQQAITQRIDDYNQHDFALAKRETQTIALLESQNHILAEDIVSPFNIPRQNVSAMDGYSIVVNSALDESTTIEIVGESQAGSPYVGKLTAGQGIRIFTGAVVPDDGDTVIMQENTNFSEIRESIDKSKPYDITLTQAAKVDDNIRKQGEEIEVGETVLQAGKRINPADISLLANLGIAKVDVYQPLKVAVMATGDELVALGQPLTSLAQIYNSNTPTLKTLLSGLPVTIVDYGIIPDNLEQTVASVTRAMRECDVLITTAGVSVGDYDFLTTVIERLGKINHYKVAMKPGKPFVFGELLGDKDNRLAKPVLFFGLPGNPLSTLVGTSQLVIPSLWRLSGVNANDMPMLKTVKATLENDVRKSVGRKEFQRGFLSQQDNGEFTVNSFAKQQSHRIKQLSKANCLVVLAQDSGNLSAGESVQVQPFPWS